MPLAQGVPLVVDQLDEAPRDVAEPDEDEVEMLHARVWANYTRRMRPVVPALFHRRLAPAAWLGVSFAVILATSLRAEAQPGPPPPPPNVVVTVGNATLRAAPDRAIVSLSAVGRAPTPAAAQRQSAEAMAAVQKKLLAAGVSADAIRTVRYELQPQYDFANGRQTLKGYVATNNVDVRIDAIERVGGILDDVVASGANEVTNIRFDLRERDAREREALRLAVTDARARADAAAAGAGLVVESVLRIEEAGAEQEVPRPIMQAMRADRAAVAESTPVSPGEIEIRARVTLTARTVKR